MSIIQYVRDNYNNTPLIIDSIIYIIYNMSTVYVRAMRAG